MSLWFSLTFIQINSNNITELVQSYTDVINIAILCSNHSKEWLACVLFLPIWRDTYISWERCSFKELQSIRSLVCKIYPDLVPNYQHSCTLEIYYFDSEFRFNCYFIIVFWGNCFHIVLSCGILPEPIYIIMQLNM